MGVVVSSHAEARESSVLQRMRDLCAELSLSQVRSALVRWDETRWRRGAVGDCVRMSRGQRCATLQMRCRRSMLTIGRDVDAGTKKCVPPDRPSTKFVPEPTTRARVQYPAQISSTCSSMRMNLFSPKPV